MPALDTVLAWNVAPGAGVVQVTNFGAGDSPRVRVFNPSSYALLLNVVAHIHVPGSSISVHSATMHDNVNALRFIPYTFTSGVPGTSFPLMSRGIPQRMKSQDFLTIDVVNGSAVVGDVENVVLSMYYDDLPGVNARLIDARTLDALAKEQVTIFDDTGVFGSPGAAGYGSATLLGAVGGTGSFKKDRDYALVGYSFMNMTAPSTDVGGVTIIGADTGGLRVLMPGVTFNHDYTANWFYRQSQVYGLPTIPVFNQKNIPGSVVEIVGNELGSSVLFTLYFVRIT